MIFELFPSIVKVISCPIPFPTVFIPEISDKFAIKIGFSLVIPPSKKFSLFINISIFGPSLSLLTSSLVPPITKSS